MSAYIGTTPRWEGFANPTLSWNSEQQQKDPAGCEGSDYSPTQQEGAGGGEGGVMEGIIQGVGGFVGGVQEFLNEFEL